jgi:hypothetical protein
LGGSTLSEEGNMSGFIVWLLVKLGVIVGPGEDVLGEIDTLRVDRISTTKFDPEEEKIFVQRIKDALEKSVDDFVAEVNLVINGKVRDERTMEEALEQKLSTLLAEFKWQYRDVMLNVDGRTINPESLLGNVLHEVAASVGEALQDMDKQTKAAGITFKFRMPWRT